MVRLELLFNNSERIPLYLCNLISIGGGMITIINNKYLSDQFKSSFLLLTRFMYNLLENSILLEKLVFDRRLNFYIYLRVCED